MLKKILYQWWAFLNGEKSLDYRRVDRTETLKTELQELMFLVLTSLLVTLKKLELATFKILIRQFRKETSKGTLGHRQASSNGNTVQRRRKRPKNSVINPEDRHKAGVSPLIHFLRTNLALRAVSRAIDDIHDDD